MEVPHRAQCRESEGNSESIRAVACGTASDSMNLIECGSFVVTLRKHGRVLDGWGSRLE